MSPLFRPTSTLGLVFHIGTSSVYAGLVRFERDKPPHVVHTLREPIPYQDNLDPNRFLSLMLDALKAANARVLKEGLAAAVSHDGVRHVSYVFSSPWVFTQSKTASINGKEPFTLTRDQVEKLIESHEKALSPKIADESARDVQGGIKVIEKKVVDIKLNGYQIADPFGMKARSVDIAFLTSVMPAAVYEKIVDVATQAYHPHDTRAFSFMLVAFSALRDAFPKESDFVIVDIGGEMTDIAVVEEGRIIETASFPLGGRSVIRAMSASLGISAAETASQIALCEEGRADDALETKIAPAFNQALGEWMKGFDAAVGKAKRAIALPSRIFIAADGDLAVAFERTLASDEATPSLLDQSALGYMVSSEAGAEKDTFVTLIAAFLNRVYESD